MRPLRQLAHARLAKFDLPLRGARTSFGNRYRAVHHVLNTAASVSNPLETITFSHQTSLHEIAPPSDGSSSAHTHDGSPSGKIISSAIPGHGAGRALLPVSCPGCGALAHQVDSTDPGFYTRSRKAVREYLKSKKAELGKDKANQTPDEQLSDAPTSSDTLSTDTTTTGTNVQKYCVPIPVCDRCHDLLYNLRGSSIAHPSLSDLADSIAESPFTRNHVYHVLDAADFPMSLEPKILSQLSLAKPRSQNRRSQNAYPHKPTLSFIITRSDLLAPTKEKVDTMMPYFQTVLRAALGRVGLNMRLGNVHLVSAKRGWWTKEIKDDIWKRGGANWMVGKFNVGKSNLFEVLFPKGSDERAPSQPDLAKRQVLTSHGPELLPESALLPPPQPESPFPALPLVSNLPGTTASPIRIPFGNHRGELIDLPGLQRSNLDEAVLPGHKLDLVMTSRPKVSQHNIKPGQSLLLGGGLVRITPVLDVNDPSTIMMAYPFVPLGSHVTATDKAVGIQQQIRESGLESILAADVGERFKSAGIITLDTDVTRHHAGPLLRAGVSLDRLPFRVYSTDLLIEGVGWVELVCQARRSRRPGADHSSSEAIRARNEKILLSDEETKDEFTFRPYTPTLETASNSINLPSLPTVEVFTPDGKHTSKRIPLGAWTLWKEGGGKQARAAGSVRPRQSMRGVKKREKMAKRAEIT